jgi:DNA polymerase-4
MDAFFASVEQLDDPALRGRPVLVGGRGRRGVVAAASYEARAFGCRSAQPTAVALRLCPEAAVVKPNGARYRAISARVFEILGSFSPLVQPVSVDEAFVDVSGSARLFGDGVAIARAIRERIREETRLTASVGVAPNKFLAKLASDLDKPDGLTVIEPGRVHAVLDPLPVGRLWGVGKASEARLARLGLRTIGDIRRMDESALVANLGERTGRHLARLSRGEDDRPVHTDREAKTISHERTFGEDLTDPDAVRAVLLGQTEDVGGRLRAHGRLAGSVTVKIRFGDFETITRSGTLGTKSDRTDDLWREAVALFDRWADRSFRPVRLIGMGAGHLSEPGGEQMGLFAGEADERLSRVDEATDAIRAKFGDDAIRRAGAWSRKRAQWGPGSEERGEE